MCLPIVGNQGFFKMSLLNYKILEVFEPNPSSTTDSRQGSLSVLIKSDHEIAQAQVYSEIVANRLANILGIPVALGVPAKHNSTQDTINFVALMAYEEDRKIYDFTSLDNRSYEQPNKLKKGIMADIDHLPELLKLIKIYPKQISYIAVFDYWIGNQDRPLNFKAELQKDGRGLIFALDQGSSLLACKSTIDASFEALKNTEYPSIHPFQKLLSPLFVGEMIERINGIPDWALESATIFDENIGNVTIADQYGLFESLRYRRKFLREKIKNFI